MTDCNCSWMLFDWSGDAYCLFTDGELCVINFYLIFTARPDSTELFVSSHRALWGRDAGGRRPPLFSTGGRVKFVQKLVHCCNWLLTETQCKIISVQQNYRSATDTKIRVAVSQDKTRSAVAIFLMCMSVRVWRPKLFKNLCLSLVSGVPHFFF